MNAKYSTARYGSLSIGLHWVMLLLLVAVYALIELREFFPKGGDIREGMKALHFMLGLSVLALVVVRLAARAFGPPAPRIEPEASSLQQKLAKVMHVALYALMIGMPLGGWLILSAAGKPIPFFGFELPALISQSQDFAHLLKEIHEVGGNAGYALIGLHAVAALFHHYVLHDNTLRRMLPVQAAG